MKVFFLFVFFSIPFFSYSMEKNFRKKPSVKRKILDTLTDKPDVFVKKELLNTDFSDEIDEKEDKSPFVLNDDNIFKLKKHIQNGEIYESQKILKMVSNSIAPEELRLVTFLDALKISVIWECPKIESLVNNCINNQRWSEESNREITLVRKELNAYVLQKKSETVDEDEEDYEIVQIMKGLWNP